MDISMVLVCCFVDDWLKDRRLRQHRPQPTLSDSEVLTIEMVDAFLGTRFVASQIALVADACEPYLCQRAGLDSPLAFADLLTY